MTRLHWAWVVPLLLAAALGQQRRQEFSVPTTAAHYQNLRQTITALATAATDEATELAVTARLEGWIEQVRVNTTYQPVRAGEVLCTLYSPQAYAAEQEYVFAVHNRAALAGSPVEGVAAGAAALVADARQRLGQMQVPAEEITRLERTLKPASRFAIRAPATAVVTQRLALPNQQVTAGTLLYTLSALRPIWVYAEVPEASLGQVRVGQAAVLRFDAFPNRQWPARVAFINPQMDAASRTGRVRLQLANSDGAIVPGMFGQAELAVALGRELVIPASAVIHSGSEDLAFVAGAGGAFTPRRLVLGPQAGERVVVRRGLRAGERVAAGAAFLVDSEAQLSAAAGSFAPPPGAAAAPGGRLQLTTAPSPPRPGRNTFRVRLTTRAGAPITGAQLQLLLSLPAMPAMGMAGVRVEVPLHETAGGFYEGQAVLPSGGTWQVVLTARQGGATVAELQTSLRAAGGGQ